MTCHLTVVIGDYDALLVLMMLPRMVFKAELVIDQLKQQHNFDDALGSLSTVTPPQADQLAFVSLLVYKLTSLTMLVKKANGSVLLYQDVVWGWGNVLVMGALSRQEPLPTLSYKLPIS